MGIRVKKLRFTISACLFGWWFLLLPDNVSAQLMNLQFTPSQGIWDVTGNYPDGDFDTGTITLIQDEKGKITGTGSASGSESGIDVSLVYHVNGSIKTVSSLTRVLLTMKIAGTATDGVITLPVKGNVKFQLDLDAPNQILIGNGNGSLCVKGRCQRAEGPVQFDIPQPMDGSWTLALNTQLIDRKILGTATATLSNGRTLPFTLNGQFSTNARSPSRINLKGAAGSITLEEPQVALAFFLTKGKLLGQSVPTSP